MALLPVLHMYYIYTKRNDPTDLFIAIERLDAFCQTLNEDHESQVPLHAERDERRASRVLFVMLQGVEGDNPLTMVADSCVQACQVLE